MTTHDHLPRKGEVLAGKYQVEEILGAGGMGVVVAARHVALRQKVALKFLLPEVMQLPGAAARFLREAQAAAAIQSEHVARVLDVGKLQNGAPYMVMEYLTGADLSRHLEGRGPLPVEDAIDFVLQAMEALAEAHALGIVHRDLKPANLFLARRADGSSIVKVLDFGLSKMLLSEDAEPQGGLTATNVAAGSPYYMSPEQVRSFKHVDARTDVWALGVILYELLTQRLPFEGHTPMAIGASVIADTPASLRTLRADIPPLLDGLVFACLEKDMGRRIPSVAHLANSLSAYAPRRSEPLIERIHRLLPGAVPADAMPTLPVFQRSPQPVPAPPGPLAPRGSLASGLVSWGSSVWRVRKAHAPLLVLAVVASVVVGVAMLMIVLRRDPGPSVTASPGTTASTSDPLVLGSVTQAANAQSTSTMEPATVLDTPTPTGNIDPTGSTVTSTPISTQRPSPTPAKSARAAPSTTKTATGAPSTTTTADPFNQSK